MYWFVFYILGLAIAVIGIGIFIKKYDTDKYASLWLLVALFFTVFIWYIPIETHLEDYLPVEGILSAVLQGVAALKADSYEKNIAEAPETVAALFSASIMLVRVIMLFLTFSVVMSLFGRTYQYILNYRKRSYKTYIFYGVNKKTISIAKSINNDDKNRLVFIITNDLGDEDKEQIKALNGIYFFNSTSWITMKAIRQSNANTMEMAQEIFIFSDDENENIEVFNDIYELIKEDKNTYRKIYVELKNASWDLQNDLQGRYERNSNMEIDFIRTEENFAYNNLYNRSIFENAVVENDSKVLKLLFIGMDYYSFEMIKLVLWLGQMPGYKVQISVIDTGTYIDKLKFYCPGIIDHIDKVGTAIYSIKSYKNIDYESAAFASAVEENADFTFAFINTGKDINNYNISIYLRSVRNIHKISSNCIVQMKNQKVNLFNRVSEGNWCNVYEVGSDLELYSYNNITNSSIDNAAMLIHTEYKKIRENYEQRSWEDYCFDEYKKKSMYARALGVKYKLEIIDKEYNSDYQLIAEDEGWLMYEHMRWNVYTWTLGYIKGDTKDIIGKTHTDLLDYSKLPDEKKKNDIIYVNDEIISYLKS